MEKRKVSIIMASSLDGKITLPNYEKGRFTSNEDKKFLMKMRSKYDCVIMGANTIRKGCSSVVSNLIKSQNQPLNVLVSTNLRFNIEKLRYFRNKEVRRVIFTTKDAPIKKRKEFEKMSDLFIVKKDKRGLVDIKEVYDILIQKYKCKRILVEGGGIINRSFLDENIADDIYLTICPIIIGDTTARSFVEGVGLSKDHIKKLKLLGCRRNNFSEIFLHYKIQKNIRLKWKKRMFSWRLVNQILK